MRLAIISDEISRDPLTAAEIAAEWGLRHLELRMYYGTRATAELAAARGIAVAIENEPICYAADGRSLARLLAEIDHPNCGANWDPANAYAYRPQDFRVGYEALRGRIIHLHIKDHAPQPDGTRRVAPPGEGAVDWPGQTRALSADGYDGLAVIETHFAPKVAAGRACVQALRRILDEAGESLE